MCSRLFCDVASPCVAAFVSHSSKSAFEPDALLGADDPAVAERVQAHMERTMQAFRNALKNAVQRGEVEPLDPDAVSRHLTATLQGLGIMRRAGATMDELGGAVGVALSVIRPTSALPASDDVADVVVPAE